MEAFQVDGVQTAGEWAEESEKSCFNTISIRETNYLDDELLDDTAVAERV